MKIKWLGHSAFLITADAGTKIITDPYVPGAYDNAVGYKRISEKADVVTVSHEHPDHCGSANLPGSPQVLKGTGPWTVAGIKISGIDTFHDKSGGRERGRNTVFVYEVDNLRIVHLGDLGHIPDEATLKALGRVDVLLIPVGGVFTIDAQEAAKLVSLLKPKVVIPMHYKTPSLSFQIEGVDGFLRVAPNSKRIGKSEVEISLASLPDATETWVLEPAL
ncbi:MAG: MBL fold metallo-hydrolase [candidate division WOR-3 bacterium]